LKRLNNNLTSIESVLFSLANAVEAKDPHMRGHVERVSKLAVKLGGRLCVSQKEIDALHLGGVLHDIGKIGVPDNILLKPGPLDPIEWRVMQKHTVAGYKICLPLQNNLGLALRIIRHHHEKDDGSGYPDGLSKDETPLVVRIMSVVDYYDALVTDRPYRKALQKEKAFNILRKQGAEGKFDFDLIDGLIGLLEHEEHEIVSGCKENPYWADARQKYDILSL
jgi:putative two-component system response regulator